MTHALDLLHGASRTIQAGDNQIKRIASLIAEEDETNQQVATAEALLAEAKTRRYNIRRNLLPEAMHDAGMTEFVAEGGIKVTLGFATDGALGSPKTPEEYAERERKLDLIEANGGGEIIKMTVALEFPKELFARSILVMATIKAMLDNIGLGAKVRMTRMRTVNHQTLGSWIRERMGADQLTDRLPQAVLDDLGIWYGEMAKINRPKEKAPK